MRLVLRQPLVLEINRLLDKKVVGVGAMAPVSR